MTKAHKNTRAAGLMSARTWLFRHFPAFRRLGGLKHAFSVIGENKNMRDAFDRFCSSEGAPDLSDDSKAVFKEAFARFNWQQHRQMHIWQEFLDCDIALVNRASAKVVDPVSPTVVCVIKDDLARLIAFLSHYRMLGVQRFVFMDNGSTDGTFELLNSQPDVDLWLCEMPYTTERREAWITRLLAHYGFDRWYLCVDSDELFVYPGCESSSIHEFVAACERRGNRRARSVMLDMYSDQPMPLDDDGEDIRDTYRFFDVDTYETAAREKLDEVRGGPRSRVLAAGDTSLFLLTKYPLFRFERGDIQGYSHFQFPYDENYEVKCMSVLLHYKFLANDMAKYIQRANQGNYASGSLEYKEYARKFGDGQKISFFDPAVSRSFDSSESLLQLKEVNEWR